MLVLRFLELEIVILKIFFEKFSKASKKYSKSDRSTMNILLVIPDGFTLQYQ